MGAPTGTVSPSAADSTTVPTMSGTLAAILGLPGSKKWIARLGRAGTSRHGVGAPGRALSHTVAAVWAVGWIFGEPARVVCSIRTTTRLTPATR